MVSGFFISLLIFFLTCGVMSFVLLLVIWSVGHLSDNMLYKDLKLASALALAPALVSLLLHYQFLFIKNAPNLVYIFIVLFVYAFLFYRFRHNFNPVKNYFKEKLQFYSATPADKIGKEIVSLPFVHFHYGKWMPDLIKIGIYFLAFYLAHQWFWRIVSVAFSGHDVLEYAIQGKIFGVDKTIDYVKHRYSDVNDFYYVGLHGFTFPLFRTWEYLISDLFGRENNDFFFRAITGYYAYIVFFLSYTIIKKVNLKMAIAALAIMLFTYGFSLTIKEYHIDTLRICFVILSLVWMVICLTEEKDNALLFVFGLVLGTLALIHSFGFFISLIIMMAYLLFDKQAIKYRFFTFSKILIVFFFTGGFHYLLDIFIGTGWIFQNIKFY